MYELFSAVCLLIAAFIKDQNDARWFFVAAIVYAIISLSRKIEGKK